MKKSMKNHHLVFKRWSNVWKYAWIPKGDIQMGRLGIVELLDYGILKPKVTDGCCLPSLAFGLASILFH